MCVEKVNPYRLLDYYSCLRATSTCAVSAADQFLSDRCRNEHYNDIVRIGYGSLHRIWRCGGSGGVLQVLQSVIAKPGANDRGQNRNQTESWRRRGGMA